MTLRRIGKYYYIDLRIRGAKKRIRRALHTSDKVDALDKYKEEKEWILAEYLRKDLKFEDFAKKYLDWAWSSKLASAIINRQPKKDVFIFDIPNRRQSDLMRRTFNQIKKRTGIDFHLHLLRHYFATSLIEKGGDGAPP